MLRVFLGRYGEGVSYVKGVLREVSGEVISYVKGVLREIRGSDQLY